MKDKKKLAILVALIVVGIGLSYEYIINRSQEGPNVIRVSGNIEVTDAEVSFRIPGRVEKRLVSEGELVKSGRIVARLDTSELAQEVFVRRAEVKAAQAVLAELEAGSRPEEITQAEAAHELERAEAERLRVESQRHQRLHEQDFISASDYDRTATAYRVAQEKVKEAKARLTLLRKGPREEVIEQARARLQQAKENLALTETRLGYATLASPLTGVVLSENVESGEYVSAGTPIVTVGDLVHVWLRAYVDETDLGRVKVGQSVRVTTDTYPGKIYEGRISFIASEAEFTPKNVQTEKERVKLVYRIKVDIHNPDMELKPGMPADATILLDGIPRNP